VLFVKVVGKAMFATKLPLFPTAKLAEVVPTINAQETLDASHFPAMQGLEARLDA
jgi:hypothetical protein